MTASEIIGCIFLARDKLLRMEELSVSAGADLINNSGLQVNHNATGHMLASTSLAEESVEGIISTTNGLVRGHLTIWLDAMLEAEELPAGVSDLNSGLTDVDAKSLTHLVRKCSQRSPTV